MPSASRSSQIVVQVLFGLFGVFAGFCYTYALADGPALGPASLCNAFQPWPWRSNCLALAGIGGLLGLALGACAAWLVHLANGFGPVLARWVTGRSSVLLLLVLAIAPPAALAEDPPELGTAETAIRERAEAWLTARHESRLLGGGPVAMQKAFWDFCAPSFRGVTKRERWERTLTRRGFDGQRLELVAGAIATIRVHRDAATVDLSVRVPRSKQPFATRTIWVRSGGEFYLSRRSLSLPRRSDFADRISAEDGPAAGEVLVSGWPAGSVSATRLLLSLEQLAANASRPSAASDSEWCRRIEELEDSQRGNVVADLGYLVGVVVGGKLSSRPLELPIVTMQCGYLRVSIVCAGAQLELAKSLRPGDRVWFSGKVLDWTLDGPGTARPPRRTKRDLDSLARWARERGMRRAGNHRQNGPPGDTWIDLTNPWRTRLLQLREAKGRCKQVDLRLAGRIKTSPF